MEHLSWVKDLVEAEKNMHETGLVDVYMDILGNEYFTQQSIRFITTLRNDFTQAVNMFNDLIDTPNQKIKIYSISRSQADFMLFRNGLKLMCSLKKVGEVCFRMSYLNPQPPVAGETNTLESKDQEDIILGVHGPMGNIEWQYKNRPINTEALIRYYMIRFTRESVL